MKIQKSLLRLALNFFYFREYFNCFTMLLKYKKTYLFLYNLIIINRPYEKN